MVINNDMIRLAFSIISILFIIVYKIILKLEHRIDNIEVFLGGQIMKRMDGKNKDA